MKCYYDELDVGREASDAEIKAAYRKMALRWHPDKNLSCAEEAKERFQLIRQAYDVLSDARERAFYDNHREQILRGRNSNYEDNSIDLFQYFTVSCYKGHGDDEKGFYAVFREVFMKIAAEDAEFMEDEEYVAQMPEFGDSQSSYEEVVGPFYAYWSAYCTKKTFTWLCPYDIQDIKGDRRILRELEKETKKTIQIAKKERNEEVRNLVAFIRKRDRRVQAYKARLEERAALNRQKQEQLRLEKIRARQRELEEMRLQNNSHHNFEDYEEQLKQLEKEYSEDEDDEVSGDDQNSAEDENAVVADAKETEEELYMDDLYCVACNRVFKNEKAFANHETSRKHRENVELLRQEMQEDEETYQDSDEKCAENEQTVDSEAETFLDGDVEKESDLNEETLSAEEAKEAQEAPIVAKKSKKNKKSKKAQKSQVNQTLSDLSDFSDQEEDEPVNEFVAPVNEDNSDVEDWNNSSKKSAGRKNKTKKQAKKQSETKTTTAAATSPITPPKDASAQDIAELLSKATLRSVEDVSIDAAQTHFCVTCHASFDSKNKLFAHLKKTNHGVYIPKAKAPTEPEKPTGHKKVKGRRNK